MPVGFMMHRRCASPLVFGSALKSDAEAAHEGCELIDTNY